MARGRNYSDLYRVWLIGGFVVQVLMLLGQYILLSENPARFEYFAILIERQFLTLAVTGGALFAAAWSDATPTGRRAVLAGVISSLALALLSLHFDYWEHVVGPGEIEPWSDVLVNFRIGFAVPLLLIPLAIGAFAALMAAAKDYFAENHSRRREIGVATTAALWWLLIMIMFVTLLYDVMLLRFFDSRYLEASDYIHIGFRNLIINLYTDPSLFWALLGDAFRRPASLISPLYTFGVAVSAQILVTREIRRRGWTPSGSEDKWA